MTLNEPKPRFKGQIILWRWIYPNCWRYGHSYCGKRIGNRTQAFKWYHCNDLEWPLTHISRSRLYVRRQVTRLLVSCVISIQWYRFQWPWVTLNLDFKAMGVIRPTDAIDVLCAQLTRDLLAIAKFMFTKIWWFSDFQNGGRPPSWICYDITILHCRTHFCCPNIVLKFHVDRCCSFRDTCNIISRPFDCRLHNGPWQFWDCAYNMTLSRGRGGKV